MIWYVHGGLVNNMMQYIKLDEFRKMNIWINEMPSEGENYSYKYIDVYEGNNNIQWFQGVICIELKIAPRVASNYAMLKLRFVKDESLKFKVVYKFSEEDSIVKSDIAMLNDTVKTGIVKAYFESMQQYFESLYQQEMFPSGTLEILGGRYGMVGSSDIAISILLDILLSLFKTNKELSQDTIKKLSLELCKNKNI